MSNWDRHYRPRLAVVETSYQWGCCRCGRGLQDINFEFECENSKCKHPRCDRCLKAMGVGANANWWWCHECRKADNILGLLCTRCRHPPCELCQRMI